MVLRATCPDHPEPDLSGWRSDRELDDRAAVVDSVVNFLDGLKVENRLERASAYDTLIDLAPEFLKEFTRRDGLAVERFYREAISRAGEFRSDRPTIPLVGPLFTRENNKRLQDALAYASRTVEQKPDALLWVIPDVPWGLTRVLPLTLERIVRHIAGAGEDGGTFHRVAIRARGRERHIADAFTVVDSEAYDLPLALELLVIPRMLVAALIHSPVRAQLAFPVPLGVMSFEPEVVARAEALLFRQLSARPGGGAQSFDYERALSRKAPPQE